jgi:glucosyl-3-phosphoglycerate phosphatase
VRRLVIWRHGRTAWNAEHRFQGQTDVPLDAVGQQQVRRAAVDLAALEPTVLVASDLQRARDTAAALAELTGLSVRLDERLRETYAGEWQGLTRAEIRARYGDELDQWATGSDLRPGGGERRTEVAERVAAAVEEIVEGTAEDAVIVIATHGGAARAGIGLLLGLPVEHWSALGVLTNAAWSVLLGHDHPAGVSGPTWRLQEYNARSLPERVPRDGVWPADDR